MQRKQDEWEKYWDKYKADQHEMRMKKIIKRRKERGL